MKDKIFLPLKKFYEEVPRHTPLALIGSNGYLEVSISRGNAAEHLKLKIGDLIKVHAVQLKPGL